jgi:hypothetical protein
MRLAALASILTAGVMWLALGGNPVQSQSSSKPATCEACARKGGGSECSHCQGCPHCKGGSHHGWHGAHKWEYKCVHQSERANKKAAAAMTQQFSAMGEDGWSLSRADNGFWCFRRVRGAR